MVPRIIRYADVGVPDYKCGQNDPVHNAPKERRSHLPELMLCHIFVISCTGNHKRLDALEAAVAAAAIVNIPNSLDAVGEYHRRLYNDRHLEHEQNVFTPICVPSERCGGDTAPSKLHHSIRRLLELHVDDAKSVRVHPMHSHLDFNAPREAVEELALAQVREDALARAKGKRDVYQHSEAVPAVRQSRRSKDSRVHESKRLSCDDIRFRWIGKIEECSSIQARLVHRRSPSRERIDSVGTRGIFRGTAVATEEMSELFVAPKRRRRRRRLFVLGHVETARRASRERRSAHLVQHDTSHDPISTRQRTENASHVVWRCRNVLRRRDVQCTASIHRLHLLKKFPPASSKVHDPRRRSTRIWWVRRRGRRR